MNHTAKTKELNKQQKHTLIIVLVVAAVLILAVIAGAVIAELATIGRHRDLSAHGLHATGTITKIDRAYQLLGSYGGYNSYFIDYTFPAATQLNQEPRVTARHIEITAQDSKSMSVGSKIDVLYEAGQPSVNMPASTAATLNPSTAIGIKVVVAFALIFALMAVDKKHLGLRKRKGLRGLLFSIVTVSGSAVVAGLLIGPALIAGLQNILF